MTFFVFFVALGLGYAAPAAPMIFEVSVSNVSYGLRIRLRFPVTGFFFCELLKVAYLRRFAGAGEGCKVRPRLPSSRAAAVLRPPLEFVSNGVLFLRTTCKERYCKLSADWLYLWAVYTRVPAFRLPRF